ncbi:MAG: DUF2232 domain-containing protein [Elusimicrobia bacterium]|nr:DUF2232 domain-containing protein [Elusimicrobiota bacterium]
MSTIKQFLFFSIATFLFFISGFYLPAIGLFILPLSSVSIVLLFMKNGVLAGVCGMILSALAIYKIIPAGYLFLILFILFVSLNSLVLYHGITRKNKPLQTVLDSCIITSIILVAGIIFMFMKGFQISWVFDKVMVGLPKDKVGMIVEIISRNIYAIMVIFAIINVFFSYIFLSYAAPKFNITIERFQSYEEWRMPEQMIFFLIFSILFYMITAHFKYNVFPQVFENMLYLVFFLYFIGGLTIGKYFFNKNRLMVVIIYLIFLLYPPLAMFLGISDVWFNFRKKKGGSGNEDYLKTGS